MARRRRTRTSALHGLSGSRWPRKVTAWTCARRLPCSPAAAATNSMSKPARPCAVPCSPPAWSTSCCSTSRPCSWATVRVRCCNFPRSATWPGAGNCAWSTSACWARISVCDCDRTDLSHEVNHRDRARDGTLFPVDAAVAAGGGGRLPRPALPAVHDVFRAGRNSPPAVGPSGRARERFRSQRKVSRSGPMPEPTVGNWRQFPHSPDKEKTAGWTPCGVRLPHALERFFAASDAGNDA